MYNGFALVIIYFLSLLNCQKTEGYNSVLIIGLILINNLASFNHIASNSSKFRCWSFKSFESVF